MLAENFSRTLFDQSAAGVIDLVPLGTGKKRYKRIVCNQEEGRFWEEIQGGRKLIRGLLKSKGTYSLRVE